VTAQWPPPEPADLRQALCDSLRKQGLSRGPGGELLVARWDDIVSVAERPDDFGQFQASALASGFSPNSMAATDEPEHSRKRDAAKAVFARDHLLACEPPIRVAAHSLIDRFAVDGIAFRRDFARSLPVQSLVALLGLPASAAQPLIEAYAGDDRAASRILADEAGVEQSRAAVAPASLIFHASMLELLRAGARTERSGLALWLHGLEGHIDPASLEYLVSELSFFFFAGSSTVTELLTSAVRHLLTSGEWQRLVSDPGFCDAAINEALRLDAPIHWLHRVARRDTSIGDVPVVGGTVVVLLWTSGNRDESRFFESDSFAPGRDEAEARGNLGFGRGIHRCLAAPFVRLQVRIALETLAERLPNVRIATSEPAGELLLARDGA
jgi:cytochrome P450